MSHRLLCTFVVAPTIVGCARTLPPLPEPPNVMPAVESPGPVPDGHTRVVLDAVDADGRTMRTKAVEILGVSEVRSGNAYGTVEHGRKLCTTPCIADLEPGEHTLRFVHEEYSEDKDAEIVVHQQPLLVRQAVGSVDPGSSGVAVVLTTLGILGSIGTSIWYGTDSDSSLAGAALGLTLGMFVAGVVVGFADPVVRQPGSNAVYPIEAPPKAQPGEVSHAQR